MSINIPSIIKDVSTSPLNDQESGFEYTRWPIPELTDYMNQGLAELNSYRPDAFLDTIVLTLVTGSQQDIPINYRQLKSVDSMADTSICFPGVPITQCDLELMKTFFKKPPMPTGGIGGFRIINYGYDVKNPKIYFVSPSVPIGMTVDVNATLVLEPIIYVPASGNNWNPANNIPIDGIYETALKFFMAARAFELDTESATSQLQSEKFYKKFYNSLGVKYTQDTKYNSGTFAGQGGSNQMTKARVP